MSEKKSVQKENFGVTLAKLFYPEIFSDLDKCHSDLEYYKVQNKKLSDESLKYADEISRLNVKIVQLEDVNDSPINVYFLERFKPIENIRYVQKRKIGGKPIAVELNQFIRPEQFEVQKVLRKIKPVGDVYEKTNSATNFLAKNTVWTDDVNLDTSGDYYLYPEESLVLGKCDCEDVHFALASLLPDYVGVAYGFAVFNGKRVGHAFGVFAYKDELYVAEATGNKAVIKKYEGSEYKIHYVVTNKYCFAIDRSVLFGKLAGWED